MTEKSEHNEDLGPDAEILELERQRRTLVFEREARRPPAGATNKEQESFEE